MQKKSIFAERLQELMEDANLNASALTNLLGCGHYTINRYQSGELPSLEMIIIIADFFKCSIDFLLGREDESISRNFLNCPPFQKRFPYLLSYFKISAYRLQKLTGISESVITYWRQGKCSPTLDSVVRIANTLSCSVDFVIGRINEE